MRGVVVGSVLRQNPEGFFKVRRGGGGLYPVLAGVTGKTRHLVLIVLTTGFQRFL